MTLAGDTRPGASFTLIRGGAVDDNFVVFSKADGDTDIKATDELTLAANFAVTADGPGGITRMVTNEALPSLGHPSLDDPQKPRCGQGDTRSEGDVKLPIMAMADASDDFMSSPEERQCRPTSAHRSGH